MEKIHNESYGLGKWNFLRKYFDMNIYIFERERNDIFKTFASLKGVKTGINLFFCLLLFQRVLSVGCCLLLSDTTLVLYFELGEIICSI